YRVIGFEFGEGRFRAHADASLHSGVDEVVVTLRDGGEFDRSLAKVPLELFGLEMRSAPIELRLPISVREFGAVFVPGSYRKRRLAAEFDAVIFVRTTTAARPTPTGVRPSRGHNSPG
ncbi:MAG TPA: hypothetical protein VEZ11_12985, partial [Thermoanaerobaculia bacterium]|nr:hypothetical protein [Thermoanaerobaculia bacterium]